MIDTFNTPDNDINNQIFYCTSGTTSWQIWQKPNGARFVYFTVLGGGAGGGGGRSGAGSGAGGGGGGGSSNIAKGLYPAAFLPDTLYIQVGNGGAGGTAGVSGSRGGLSYVSISSTTTTNAIIMQSGDAAPNGGVGPSSSTGGAGGAGGTLWLYTNNIFPQFAQIQTNSITGLNDGSIGGNTTLGGADINALFITTGGSGGGGSGTNVRGGNIVNGYSSSYVPTVSGGTTGSTDANSGYISNIPSTNSSVRLPFMSTGGAGGYGSNTSDGGNGGTGAYGSGGGGGGGSSVVGRVGGRGGNGGNGLVMITCW